MDKFIGFIGPSYKQKSSNVDCQRSINLIPEIDEQGTGKNASVLSLIGAPGLRLLATVGAGPHRCDYTASTEKVYCVSGNKLYRVDSAWVSTELGTLNTNVGNVSMADNGLQLMIVDGLNGYVLNMLTDVFGVITDEGYTDRNPPKQVSYMDGYFIFADGDSDNFFISGIDAVTFDPLDVSDADGYPDKLVASLVNHRELWLFGTQTTEVWFNSGDAAFPFSRNSGAYIEHGCAAAFSVAKLGNAVFWLSKDRNGQGLVYMAQGYQPKKISTNAIDQAIQSYGSISDATAYTYQADGHSYYVLNFTSANTTWVYDLATGLWHERAATSNGHLNRHRANCHAFAHGVHVVGDFENGKLYELTDQALSDDGGILTKRRVTPHVTSNGRNIFYHQMWLDLEAGVGLDGVGQGTDPKVMLRFSDDGGHTWSNEIWASMGKIGERKHRATWKRLGTSKDRVFEVTVTDAVKTVFIDAFLHFSQGGL